MLTELENYHVKYKMYLNNRYVFRHIWIHVPYKNKLDNTCNFSQK